MDSFGDINHILTIDSSKTVFLTGDYLTAVDKEKIGVADRSFNTLIADVTIGSDSLLFGGIVADKDSLNEKIQFTTDPIRFNWSAATYYPQTHTSFRYRLKGLDSEWSNWTNETYRDFTNLPGGTYSFEVQGRNIYKKIGKTASLTFEVLPPWYRTVWAYLGYVMVGVVFIIGVIKWRESKANRRQRKLEDKIDQRTRELRKEKRQLEKANKTIQQQSEQLKRMDEIKNEFFANISHELRTPLTLIRGPIRQMLQQENGIEAEYKQKLNLIDQNAERLEHMVRRILELSRLENGSLDLNWTKIEMPQFLERILSSFESLAHDHGIQLEIECTDQLGALYADQQKLEQVFTNLISNAIKFTDKRGRVILKAEEKASPEPGVQIQLEDTGRGIGSEHLAHIFDRFYNVELKEDYREGLGIGLALTKQLVELHEGNISVESEKGTGTTFTVFLPDKHKPGQAKGHEKEEPYYEQEVQAVADRTIDLTKKEPVKIESATVLVVDDNESMRHYIKGMLEKIFGTIELAEDGELALKMIEETAYDLIIADVMMPNMDGFTLAEQIMNGDRYRDIPFIFVTARAGEKEQLRGLRIGVNDYVIKPFLPEELMIRAKNLVKAYRRRKHWIKVEGSGDELDDRDDELVEKLRTFVVDHIDDSDLTVEQLAPELNYSTRQVYRKLKSLTGYTPAQFIKEVRLQHARQLLEEDSDLRISELAKAVGFNTPSYFSSQFKERFGSSPSKYS
jgi:signal transduction histidine kinase/DNA-binding response OmpR family regulator